MTWSNLETGAAQLQRVKAKFELGLHIVLTNGRPLTSHPMHSGLLDTHGNFLSFGGLLKRSYLNQISHGAVFCEIQAQYQRFVDLMGRDPDFIDGHQHIQQLPIIREAVLAAVRSRSKGQKMYVRVAGLPLSWCASGLKHSAGFVGRNLLIGLPGRALQKTVGTKWSLSQPISSGVLRLRGRRKVQPHFLSLPHRRAWAKGYFLLSSRSGG
jgi:hypothetical protein